MEETGQGGHDEGATRHGGSRTNSKAGSTGSTRLSSAPPNTPPRPSRSSSGAVDALFAVSAPPPHQASSSSHLETADALVAVLQLPLQAAHLILHRQTRIIC